MESHPEILEWIQFMLMHFQLNIAGNFYELDRDKLFGVTPLCTFTPGHLLKFQSDSDFLAQPCSIKAKI